MRSVGKWCVGMRDAPYESEDFYKWFPWGVRTGRKNRGGPLNQRTPKLKREEDQNTNFKPN